MIQGVQISVYGELVPAPKMDYFIFAGFALHEPEKTSLVNLNGLRTFSWTTCAIKLAFKGQLDHLP